MEEATDSNESAEKLFSEGDYAKALTEFKKLLKEQNIELGRAHEDTLDTQTRIASVLEKQTKYAEAVRTLIKVYKIKLSAFGILHESTVQTRCCIAELLKNYATNLATPEIFRCVVSCFRLELRFIKKLYLRGKFGEALKSVFAIWDSMKAVLNEDNPLIIRTGVIVGKIYSAREEYSKALKVFGDVYLKVRDLFGQHDRRTATSLMRKASVMHKRCEYDEALKLYVKAHEIRRDILGLTHRKTLLSLLSIARITSDVGNHDEALRVMNEVLEKQGRNHVRESLRTTINIGLLHFARSEYEEALDTFREANQVEFASRRSKAKILNNIGNSLARLGRYSDARRVLMKTIRIRKSANYHMDTLRTYRDIALTFAEEGMLTTAHALLNALIEASNNTLGSRHSVTLSIQNDLGKLYFSKSLYNEALYIFTNIWEVREKVLGSYHPDTLDAKFQVAKIYRRQGQQDRALKMYNQVWDLQKAIFYPQHPDCLTMEYEMAETYLSRNSYFSAFEMIYGIYEKKVKIYGTEHQYTREIEEDLSRFGSHVPLRRLITATVFENLEDVKKFIEEGDDVNARDVNGAVTLHYASREGYIDILKYLLSKGATYDIQDMYEQTPESFASDDATKVVFALVKQLFVNVKRNNRDEVRRILQQENSIVNARDALQRTPLQWAVSKGHEGIVQELIDHGADPLIANTEDGTVLHAAARNGDNEVMATLLRHVHRSNPEMLYEFVNNKCNSLGLAPLHIAAMENYPKCVDLLIRYKVNPMVSDVFDRLAFDLSKNEKIRVEILMYSFSFLDIYP